ncbi:unnamed protein product [Schistosoma curassoni]|uniref:Reverse transcriptase domain-containing protein n=1 Tax=Schistosoma curassoni TaxID=6186 RepID=A0A183KB90_9TREM|nr:unnamed protein product [Schistosoma curassoni]
MKTSTSEGKHGIQWTARMQLDDLDFADDLALLSHTQQQMQEKVSRNATLALPILPFTSASDPPCSPMMLHRYVKDSTSSRVPPSSINNKLVNEQTRIQIYLMK